MDEDNSPVNGRDAGFYDEQGLALAAQGKYEEAIEQYKQAIVCDSNYFKAYYNWANAFYDWGKYEDAIEICLKAVKVDDQNADVYNLWGLALSELRRRDEAIEKYKQAIVCDAKYVKAYYNWASSLQASEKYGEGNDVCKKAVEAGIEDADVYSLWALGLAELREHAEAIEKYKLAVKLNVNDGDPHFNWAISLAALKQYEAAIKKYQESIEVYGKSEKDADQVWGTYAQHNIVELTWRQGKYKESRRGWEDTKCAYMKTKQAAVRSNDADYFNYFGGMLQSVLFDSDGAEKTYHEGLAIDPNHVGILTSLVGLYIERKDNCIAKPKRFLGFYPEEKDQDPSKLPATHYWKARESFAKAETVLKGRQGKPDSDDVFLQLGQLSLALGSYLTNEEYEAAEKNFVIAFEIDKKSSEIGPNLGVLYARVENYQKAVQYLSDAVKLEPDDLTLRSNLAEAHLRAESPERAEAEYKRVLDVTQYHVESHIGLGEVYKAMGDADDDADMYYRAIQKFNEGLRIARTESGSKQLMGKSLAAAYYSRGYARVKLYEVSKLARDESLLNKARADFRKAKDNDPENYKAKRAWEKLGKRFGFRASQRFMEKVGPWTLFLLSFGVFGIAQLSIFKKEVIHELNAGYYVLLTFGSLILMVASIYLPQLLKLKVAGIELEKSAVEQFTTPTALEISK